MNECTGTEFYDATIILTLNDLKAFVYKAIGQSTRLKSVRIACYVCCYEGLI